MTAGVLKKYYWLEVILLGLILRLVLSTWINIGDILVHADWGKRLVENGFKDAFFKNGWTYSVPTQPPLITGLLAVSRWIYDQRYLLALFHNKFRFPPGRLIFWFDKWGYFWLLRLWAFLGDLGLLYGTFKFIKKLKPQISKNQVVLLTWLSPIVLMISAVWGQNGFLSSTIGIFGLVLGYQGFLFYGTFLALISILFKPTGALFAIVIGFLILKNLIYASNYKKILIQTTLGLLAFLVILGISSAPFIPADVQIISYGRGIIENRILTAAKGASRASVSAFNVYSLFFEIDKTLTTKTVIMPVNIWAKIFLLVLWGGFGVYWLSNQKDKPVLLDWQEFSLSLFLVLQGTFLLGTTMLERYFVPAYIPLIFYFLLKKKNIKINSIFWLQLFIWLTNLIYAYFWREFDWIRTAFLSNNYLLIRIMSLANIVIYGLFFKTFLATARIKINHEKA